MVTHKGTKPYTSAATPVEVSVRFHDRPESLSIPSIAATASGHHSKRIIIGSSRSMIPVIDRAPKPTDRQMLRRAPTKPILSVFVSVVRGDRLADPADRFSSSALFATTGNLRTGTAGGVLGPF